MQIRAKAQSRGSLVFETSPECHVSRDMAEREQRQRWNFLPVSSGDVKNCSGVKYREKEDIIRRLAEVNLTSFSD